MESCLNFKNTDCHNNEKARVSRKSQTPCWAVLVNPDYVQGRGQWARPEHKGYTMDWKEAGRFTETEAKEVEARSSGKYTAIPIQPNKRLKS